MTSRIRINQATTEETLRLLRESLLDSVNSDIRNAVGAGHGMPCAPDKLIGKRLEDIIPTEDAMITYHCITRLYGSSANFARDLANELGVYGKVYVICAPGYIGFEKTSFE